MTPAFRWFPQIIPRHFCATALLLVLAAGHIATTYVIKEGDVEVGRWEENDGKKEIQIVGEDKPQPAKPVPAPEMITGDVGYQSHQPSLEPGTKVAEWKIAGKVIDLLRLRPIGPCEVLFEGEGQKASIKTSQDGYFSGKLPALEKGVYMIMGLKAPVGYERFAHVLQGGKTFSEIPYLRRIILRGVVPQASPIRGSTFDIQVGLYPTMLTEQEAKDYQDQIYGKNEA